MKPFIYNSNPARIIFGTGTIAQLPDEVKRLGIHRPLVLSTPQQSSHATQIEDLLKASGIGVAGQFNKAAMHTPSDVTMEAMKVVEELNVDGLVAIGGGSTIGLGKAIALRTDLPQIVLPTTYAGSEMTPIIGQTENGLKTTQSTAKVLPEVVIYDVDFTYSLPVELSATSGMNAIAHSVEGLYAQNGNPVIGLMAEEGIRALAKALPVIVENPTDKEARSDALYGAWLCGTVLGLVGMSVHHKLCHVLGGTFNLPHAETHTIVLPHALSYNARHVPDVMKRIAHALGEEDALEGLNVLLVKLKVKRALKDFGMEESGIDKAADLAVKNAYWSPRPLDRDGLPDITRHAASIRINPTCTPLHPKRRRPGSEFDLITKSVEHDPTKTSAKDSEPPLVARVTTTDTHIHANSPNFIPNSITRGNLSNASPIPSESSLPPTSPPLRSSKVPASRLGRFVHYGGLAASLSFGAATEIIRRTSGGQGSNDMQNTSVLMTEANINRLVSKLSQMRGAALKMGQFMSIQDTQVLSEDLERVFRRVQDAAHYMPNSQLEKVMIEELGESWESHFTSFPRIPSHAASIGQVHLGILSAKSSPTGKEEQVAIKVQFPNIENSISSDLGYLKLLLGASMLLPKGLFLDSTIKVFKEELADECNYKREAEYINKYRALSPDYLDSRYKIPWVWEMSTRRVLVMERMEGVSVGGDVVKTLTQEERNQIAERVIELCLRELFDFRMMQTDPNWSNFLWNKYTRQIELIDFGATRGYSSEFTDNWLRLLQAAISSDRQECIEASLKLKYFIGGENEAMTNAHILSMQLLGTPFRPLTVQPFSFARGSEWTAITDEIRSQVPIMLSNRLTPPPRETYSLNRKLSGTFLLAGRLGASVDCRKIWERVVEKRVN